jgi:hypothetical protein
MRQHGKFIKMWPLLVGLLVVWCGTVPAGMSPLSQLRSHGGDRPPCDMIEPTVYFARACREVQSNCSGTMYFYTDIGEPWQTPMYYHTYTTGVCSGPPYCPSWGGVVITSECGD